VLISEHVSYVERSTADEPAGCVALRAGVVSHLCHLGGLPKWVVVGFGSVVVFRAFEVDDDSRLDAAHTSVYGAYLYSPMVNFEMCCRETVLLGDSG